MDKLKKAQTIIDSVCDHCHQPFLLGEKIFPLKVALLHKLLCGFCVDELCIFFSVCSKMTEHIPQTQTAIE